MYIRIAWRDTQCMFNVRERRGGGTRLALQARKAQSRGRAIRRVRKGNLVAIARILALTKRNVLCGLCSPGLSVVGMQIGRPRKPGERGLVPAQYTRCACPAQMSS